MKAKSHRYGYEIAAPFNPQQYNIQNAHRSEKPSTFACAGQPNSRLISVWIQEAA